MAGRGHAGCRTACEASRSPCRSRVWTSPASVPVDWSPTPGPKVNLALARRNATDLQGSVDRDVTARSPGCPDRCAHGLHGRVASASTDHRHPRTSRPPWTTRLGLTPGSRQGVGMSVHRACDAQEWQDSGGVAGVAAQGGGDVAVAHGGQDADGEVRRLAMTRGVVPVRAWEASSAKVVSRMWCNASMPQWPWIQSARRAGWAWAAVRLVTAYMVTVRQRRSVSGRTRRVMRIAWVAWGSPGRARW
jgi:hypothetical protein